MQDLCTSIACVSESNVYHKWTSLEFHSHDYCDIRRILNSTPGPSEGCHQAYYSVQHRNVKRSRKNPPLQLKKYRLIRSGYSFVAVEVKVEKYYKTLDVRSLRKPVRFVFPGVLILTFGKNKTTVSLEIIILQMIYVYNILVCKVSYCTKLIIVVLYFLFFFFWHGHLSYSALLITVDK